MDSCECGHVKVKSGWYDKVVERVKGIEEECFGNVGDVVIMIGEVNVLWVLIVNVCVLKRKKKEFDGDC